MTALLCSVACDLRPATCYILFITPRHSQTPKVKVDPTSFAEAAPTLKQPLLSSGANQIRSSAGTRPLSSLQVCKSVLFPSSFCSCGSLIHPFFRFCNKTCRCFLNSIRTARAPDTHAKTTTPLTVHLIVRPALRLPPVSTSPFYIPSTNQFSTTAPGHCKL